MRNIFSKKTSGFTLVEMMVALGIFTIALFLATSAFLSVVNADRKSRATRIATDNLNLMLEDMSRKLKTGYDYNCGGGTGTSDCASQSTLALTDQTGLARIIYKRGVGNGVITPGSAASGCGTGYSATQGCVLRSDDGGTSFMLSTSPEIDITTLQFTVLGSAPWTDTTQPTVTVVAAGSLGSQTSTKVAFRMQTTVTQRAYDH